MGLKDKLINDGSIYAAQKNGGDITPNPLEFDSKNGTYAGTLSSLHYNAITDKPGYSVDGTNQLSVNTDFQKYNVGVANQLPTPTSFDLEDPVTADPFNRPKYTTSNAATNTNIPKNKKNDGLNISTNDGILFITKTKYFLIN